MAKMAIEFLNDQIFISTGNRINELRKSLEELRIGDFPSQTPLRLTDILLNIVNSLYEKLGEEYQKRDVLDTKEELMDLNTRLLILNNTAAKVTRYIEVISGARTERNSWSIVSSFESLINQIARQSQLIIHPKWEYNYSFRELMMPLEELASAIGEEAARNIFSGFNPHLVVLTYPTIERRTVLHNAVLAHELGHFIDEVYEISNYVKRQSIMEEHLIDSIIDTLHSKTTNTGDTTFVRKAVVTKSTRLVERWILEIVADVLGVSILGPAHIFAFEQVVVCRQTLDGVDERHAYPPVRVRLDVMLEHLDRICSVEDWETFSSTYNVEPQVIQSVKERLNMLKQLSSIERTPLQDPYCELGLRSVELALPFIIEKVSELKEKPWYFTDEQVGEAYSLVQLLDHRLPPSEFVSGDNLGEKHPGLRSIINAGWFYIVSRRTGESYFKKKPPEDVYDDFNIVNRLVEKAIEASQLWSVVTFHGEKQWS